MTSRPPRRTSRDAPALRRPTERLAAAEARLDGVLESLGVIGLGRVAAPILAAVVLDDPLLLVGGIGCAKTLLCRRLGSAVGCDILRVYDCSKASAFEDVIGLPIPQALAEGEVRYAPTPISITQADGVLLDELSRASPSNMNKWLEVVRARTIMGMALPRLRFVAAAMNPLQGHDGVFPLDSALAGRFPAIVVMPEASALSDAERLRIIRLRSEDDARGLAHRTPSPDTGPLTRLVAGARVRFAAWPDDEQATVATYVNAVGRNFERGDCQLDGRRMAMLHRLAGAGLAVVREALGEPLLLEQAGPVLLRMLENGLPFAATGQDVKAPLVRAAHEAAFALASGQRWVGGLRLPTDPILVSAALASASRALLPEERKQAITRVIEQARREDGTQADSRGAALLGLGLMARAVTRGDLRLPPDDGGRVLEAFAEVMRFPPGSSTEVLDMIDQARGDVGDTAHAARAQTALRIALRAAHGGAQGHGMRPRYGTFRPHDQQEAGRVAADVEARLDALACDGGTQ